MAELLLIEGYRGSGKTTTLLGWLREHPTGLLLTFSEREAVRLREIMGEDFTERIMVARPGCLRGQDGPTAVDNLDLVLELLFGAPVHVATTTREKRRG